MRFIYVMDKIGKTLPRAPVAVVLYAVFFLSGRAAEASTAGGPSGPACAPPPFSYSQECFPRQNRGS